MCLILFQFLFLYNFNSHPRVSSISPVTGNLSKKLKQTKVRSPCGKFCPRAKLLRSSAFTYSCLSDVLTVNFLFWEVFYVLEMETLMFSWGSAFIYISFSSLVIFKIERIWPFIVVNSRDVIIQSFDTLPLFFFTMLVKLGSNVSRQDEIVKPCQESKWF